MQNLLNTQLEEMNAPLIDYAVADTDEHMGKQIKVLNTYTVNKFNETNYILLVENEVVGEASYGDIFNELNFLGYLEL